MAVVYLHIAEVFFPEKGAFERVAEDARRAEGGTDDLAIGDRRLGSPATAYMGRFVGLGSPGDFFPQDLSVCLVTGSQTTS